MARRKETVEEVHVSHLQNEGRLLIVGYVNDTQVAVVVDYREELRRKYRRMTKAMSAEEYAEESKP